MQRSLPSGRSRRLPRLLAGLCLLVMVAGAALPASAAQRAVFGEIFSAAG
jgi:hypothetical protein